MTPPPTNPAGHQWEFKARFRRHAFGWRSQPAIDRIKQAVSEIKRIARRDPVLAADGAVILLERLSPALEHVDGSSGAIGTAVNRAIVDLVPLIGGAPADAEKRAGWLERLWAAHEADQIPYIGIRPSSAVWQRGVRSPLLERRGPQPSHFSRSLGLGLARWQPRNGDGGKDGDHPSAAAAGLAG